MGNLEDAELVEKIGKMVQEHFPSMVANELKEYLNTAQKSIGENKRLVSENQKLIAENKRLSDDLSKLKEKEFAVDCRGVELSLKEKELESKDKNLELVMVAYRNEQLVERVNELKTFVSLLVKNPRAIELLSTNHSETIPLRDNYGGLSYDTKFTQSNGTKEVVESKDENAS